MKILSYERKGDMLHIITDNVDRPEFVYPFDKFKSKEALICEIEKSILFESRRKNKLESNILNLTTELDKEVIKDA